MRQRWTPARAPASAGVIGAILLVTFCVACASRAHVPPAPPDDLRAQEVVLQSDSGSTIRGWFSHGRPGAGAVLLLHGIGASRLEMVGRARFLAGAGYSVLLIDFRGHGESSQARPTYGGLESRDARAALARLRALAPGERVAVIGISMGGAAALLGPGPLPVDALVLESVYPTIDDAVRDRLRAWLGGVGRALAPLATRVLLPRDGVTAADLRPIDRIHEQTAAVLVLAGTADRYTTIDESRALFARAPEPKALWEVEGAGHVDLHDFARPEYERRVGAFLADHLRDPASRLADARSRAEVQPEQHPHRPDPPDRGAERERRPQ